MTTNFFPFSLLLLFLDSGFGIRDKHPGSATLTSTNGSGSETLVFADLKIPEVIYSCSTVLAELLTPNFDKMKFF